MVCFDENNSGCFVIGWLKYNASEPCFELKSCGLRWCEYATDRLNSFVIKWADLMCLSLGGVN